MPSPKSLTNETLEKLQDVYRRVGEARTVLHTLSRDRVETVKVKLFSKEANQALVQASLLLQQIMDEIRDASATPVPPFSA